MPPLQILSIKIKDYRQYRGENHIQLNSNGDRTINIIEGQNGSGKSNILNAITLCFYNQETHLKSEKESGLETYPLVNRKKLEELDENQEAEGYIEIELGSDEPEYVFRREFKTVKLEIGGFSSKKRDLTLQRRVGRDWKKVDNPHTHLNEVLPVRVHEYFLFDGEQLDKFFESGHSSRVEAAILDVSHIELLNRAIEHSEGVQKQIERQMDKTGGEATRLHEIYEQRQSELTSLEEERQELEHDIADANTSRNEIDDRLQDSNDADVRQKQEKRKYLNEQLSEKESERKELISETQNLITESGAIMYNLESLQYTHRQFSEMTETGRLPPKIQDWFVEELLNNGQCICGADLESDDQKRSHLNSLQQEVATVRQEDLEGKTEIPRIIEDGQHLVDEISDNRGKLYDVEARINRINRELRDISNELKGYNLPEDVDVGALEQQRESIESRVQEMNRKLGEIDHKIEEEQDDIERAREEWKDEAAKESQNETLIRQSEFVDSVLAQLRGIKETILNKIRSETESNMNHYFNELIWKDEDYEVKLGENYNVSVLGPHGDDKIGSLSAGEKQVLALSFMSALTKISGFKAPIVIDTPLGRISSEPKKRIAQNLPTYLEDTQLTLLVTDEEYSEDVEIYLQDYVANDYVLEFAEEVTEVIPR